MNSININQFKELLKGLDDKRLQEIVQFAQAQGMSQNHITNGLNSIKELMKN